MTDGKLYLLQDGRSYVGNCVLWWAIDGKGYTSNIDEAHRFTKEEAESQHRSRKTDIPHDLERINKLARRTVDMQLLFAKAETEEG